MVTGISTRVAFMGQIWAQNRLMFSRPETRDIAGGIKSAFSA
jgi:hypothetical protein